MQKQNILQQKDESGFGDINFKPIFLWKISDKLFAEAEVEIETGDGEVDCRFGICKYVLYGKSLPYFACRQISCQSLVLTVEEWEKHLSTSSRNDPTGFGDGGIGAMNETGVGAMWRYTNW